MNAEGLAEGLSRIRDLSHDLAGIAARSNYEDIAIRDYAARRARDIERLAADLQQALGLKDIPHTVEVAP